MQKNLFLLLMMIFSLSASSQTGPVQPAAGQQAPAVSLPDINGKTVTLGSFRGTIVLVDFWASWCGPCRKNNPRLVKLYKKYHGKGLEILGISLDEKGEDWKAAVQADRLPWIQLNDDKGANAVSAAAYGVYSIPSSFLIDKNGVIRAVDLEGWPLEAAIKKLL